MIINHNLNAMNSHRNMMINNVSSGKAMEKLSSGLRINRAGDDAAGLAISEKMRGQIRGLDQASRNSQDGISLIQTAEGALNETHSILQRMRELGVQAANDTNTDTDRKEIQKEINQLTSEINRIGNTTEFNTKKLIDGSAHTTKVNLQIGANSQQNFVMDIYDMRSKGLGISGTTGGNAAKLTAGTTSNGVTISATEVAASSGAVFAAAGTVNQLTDNAGAAEYALDVTNYTKATAAVTVINKAIEQVSSERSKLGGYQNRLEHTIANLNTSSENLQASESRIRDVDMAKEMMNFSKNNILGQAAQAMLAQANQQPQGVLQLLR